VEGRLFAGSLGPGLWVPLKSGQDLETPTFECHRFRLSFADTLVQCSFKDDILSHGD